MPTYRLADTGQDYKSIRGLLKEEKMLVERLTFPCIMAFQGEDLVGVMATHLEQRLNVAIAGPLAVKSDRLRIFTVIRLVDAYDAVMRHCGLDFYLFRVDLDNHKWIDKITEVLKMEPYDIRTDGMWYKREL